LRFLLFQCTYRINYKAHTWSAWWGFVWCFLLPLFENSTFIWLTLTNTCMPFLHLQNPNHMAIYLYIYIDLVLFEGGVHTSHFSKRSHYWILDPQICNPCSICVPLVLQLFKVAQAKGKRANTSHFSKCSQYWILVPQICNPCSICMPLVLQLFKVAQAKEKKSHQKQPAK
jgi:ferredoxin